MAKYDKWSVFPFGGRWRSGTSEKECTITNPYNGEVLAKIKLANKDDVNEAYRTAEETQKKWVKTSPYEKAQIFEKAAELLRERKEEMITLLIEESGSTRLKANAEVSAAIACIKEASTFPFKLNGMILPSAVPGKENRIYRDPVGVVSVISPWNYPLSLSMRSIAPALATGNGVVVKPSMETPITGAIFIAKLFEDAGIPKGLLNVIIGSSNEIGNVFIDHPVPRVISFTGSTEAGRTIGEIAGKHLKRMSLELGGNNAFIVLDDADVERAATAAVFGKFLHQGQICMAINRIIVDRKIYRPFLDKFKKKVEGIKAGNPEESDTVVGPLINQKQVDTVLGLIHKGVEGGATLFLEGKVKGNIVEPFILTDVNNKMAIAQSEIFGPVALIIPVDGEEEAIQAANETAYGLSGAVFAGTIERGIRVARQITTGMIHVNDQTVNNEPMVPFGGEKDSGIGRHGGDWAVEEFTTVKWISVQNEERRYPFPQMK